MIQPLPTPAQPEQNFYVTGGTLRRDAPSYVSRQADEDLFRGLTEGHFCYVLTARQMGKSSLMVRTAARLRESGISVAILDLTSIGQNLSVEQWYDGLLGELGHQLNLEDQLEDFWLDQGRVGPLQRWMRAIREIVLTLHSGRVVIFIDEIDSVRSLPFSTDEFFAGIREFYNRRTEDPEMTRLSFCLLGVATPSDLIRDTRTTPFNIGQRIELNDFNEGEAGPLARGLGREEAIGAKLLQRILYWTGGHPYLTQRLCLAVAEDTTVRDIGGVDRLCGELFLSHRAQERDDNLLFVRERLLRSEADLAALLDLYGQVRKGKRVPDQESNQLIGVLRLSGVVRVVDGHLKVRNRIYERVFDPEWVKANMPDAEIQRQRAAYRKGLVRAAALASVVIAMITGLAFYAFKQSSKAKEEARRADLNLQQANMNAGIAQKNAEDTQRALQQSDLHRQQAEDQKKEADRQRQQAEAQRIEAEQQRQEAVSQQMIAEQSEQKNRRLLYAAQMNSAYRAWEDFDIYQTSAILRTQIPQPGQEDLRGFEWLHLWYLSHNGRLIHQSWVSSVGFSPDGKRLASGVGDGTIKLWDALNGQEVLSFKVHSSPVRSVAFSPDGKRLASRSHDETVKLWDTMNGQEVLSFKGPSGVYFSITFFTDGNLVAFSPDGRWLAAANGNIITLRQAATKEEVAAQLKREASK
jgi:hypothetical protein